MSVLAFTGVTKRFGPVTALDRIDLTLGQGEVRGFIGPNGAGKTTALRILMGILRADEGQVTLFGRDAWHDAADLHRRVAYVPGEVNLWPNLTGGEVIDFFTRLQGNGQAARREALIERFELDPTKKCRSYSKGNRQKVALIAAFASEAELYVLDEPTSGLDPLMELVFQELVEEARQAGRTVLLSSHILSEVERLCDSVSIIRQGQIIESGSLASLRHLRRTEIEATTREAVRGFAELKGVHELTVEGRRLQCSVDNDVLDEAIARISAAGIEQLTTSPATLEQLFMSHYRDQG